MQSLQECICNAVQQVAVVRGVPVEEQSHIQAFCAEEYCNDSQAKHYEFLGQGVLYYAVSEGLVQAYGEQCQGDILEQMRRLLFANHGALFHVIAQRYHLSGTEDISLKRIVDRLLGVIAHSQLGPWGVTTIVTTALQEQGSALLKQLPRKLRTSLGLLPPTNDGVLTPIDTTNIPKHQRPIKTPRRHSAQKQTMNEVFAFLIREGEYNQSFMERELPGRAKEWGCQIIYRLTKRSPWFSHSRYASNKKGARSLVVHDILQYYEKRPDHKASHQEAMPEEIDPTLATTPTVLVIDESEYYHEPTAVSTPPPSIEWYNPIPGDPSLYAIHIPEKRPTDDMDMDEYDARMMEVLLDGFPKMTMEQRQQEEQRRRQRLQQQQQQEHKRMRSSPPTSNEMQVPPTPPVVAAQLTDDDGQPRPSIDIIRDIVDVQRIQKILNDPVQVSNPKTGFLSLLQPLKDALDYKFDYVSSGPPHSKIFIGTSTLICGEHSVSSGGQGAKKRDAEQAALLNLLRTLANIA
ncbi:predicted protein [Lichtheimia corymbifera JMRC:FSU:9682]|uniref:DRBM domain-containing protein n=1 Tax=Lichtheimia corymbifera JMRC:FSU:9682 TaxID=1263082 RepID=A0A068RVQ7_9FUNG|nr:predicted protein [Lichtheimia corymbifera JMRC:FSU:9682]